MQKILWLKFERPPHPDAVAHPANEEELRLVLALLELPWRERNRLSGLLRNWLSAAEEQSPLIGPASRCGLGTGFINRFPGDWPNGWRASCPSATAGRSPPAIGFSAG